MISLFHHFKPFHLYRVKKNNGSVSDHMHLSVVQWPSDVLCVTLTVARGKSLESKVLCQVGVTE